MSNLASASSSLKLAFDGSDQTALINGLLAGVNISGVELDYPAGTKITINGKLNGNGKTLRIPTGVMLVGSGTVQNCMYDFTNPRSQAFGLLLNHLNVTVDTPYMSAIVFGAVGDGVTDDQPALQKASDTMIANPTLPHDLWLPNLWANAGRYLINRPWVLHHWDGTQYNQFNLTVIGNRGIQGSDSNGFARIKCNYGDSFAIGVQRACGGAIRGVSIEGPWTAQLAHEQFYTNQGPSLWPTIAPGMVDSRYEPSAGIVIDPFGGTRPTTGGYPNKADAAGIFTEWYRGGNTVSGTTWFNIDQVCISGFTVGILNSPNGITQQGEDCTISETMINYCKVSVAYCQNQSDRCRIYNLRSWYQVLTVIDTVTYGNQKGTISSIDGLNVAGTVFQLFNIFCQKSLSIKNVFAEAFFQIGYIASPYSGCTIDSSTFNFYIGPTNIRPSLHAQLTNVEINNCTMRYYDDQYNKRLWILSNNGRCINTFFDAPPIIINDYANNTYNMKFENCPCGTGFMLGATSDVQFFQYANRLPILHGDFTIQDYIGQDGDNIYGYDTPGGVSVKYRFNAQTFNRYVQSLGSYAITPDLFRTCTITIPPQYKYTIKINDYILNGSNSFVLGRVSAVSGGTITITEIPINISVGTYPLSLLFFISGTNANFVGDLTVGKNTIVNVCLTSAAIPVIGTRYEHPALPRTTYITAVDVANRIITVSMPASKTMLKQNFINGAPDIIAKSSNPPGVYNYSKAFLGGTKWIDNYSHDIPDVWVIKQGGYLNAAAAGLPTNLQALLSLNV